MHTEDSTQDRLKVREEILTTKSYTQKQENGLRQEFD